MLRNKLAESNQHRQNIIHPRSQTNTINGSYTLVWKMKEGLLLAIRQVEDEFGPFLLPLSDFPGCACAIAKMECISKLLSSTYGSLDLPPFSLYPSCSGSKITSFQRSCLGHYSLSMKMKPPGHVLVSLSSWIHCIRVIDSSIVSI